MPDYHPPSAGHRFPVAPAGLPLGARVVEDGVQFTIFSRHASRVWLMLVDHPEAEAPAREWELERIENQEAIRNATRSGIPTSYLPTAGGG